MSLKCFLFWGVPKTKRCQRWDSWVRYFTELEYNDDLSTNEKQVTANP